MTKPITMDALTSVEKYIDFFRMICLHDISFFSENQYTVACAILAVARMYSKVCPVWSPELVQLSGLQHHHFLNIEQKIMDAFDAATAPSGLQDSTASRAETGNTIRSEHERSDEFSPNEVTKVLAGKAILSD